MSTSNRERAARGGWGLGAVAGVRGGPIAPLYVDGSAAPRAFDGLSVAYPLPHEALATDEQIAASVAAKFGPAWTTRGATVVKREESTNPQPAAGQVWAPPKGEFRADLLAADGTLTVDKVHRERAHLGPHICIATADMLRPANGWRCIGVATEHGRVMVGDVYQTGGIGDRPLAVAAIGAGDSVLLRASHGWEQWTNASGLTDGGSTLRRTRYAPARVGERYLHKSRRFLVVIPATPSIFSTGPATWGDEVRVHLSVGVSMPVDEWERFDPSTASHAAGPVPQVPESDADLRARIVALLPLAKQPERRAVADVVAAIATGLPTDNHTVSKAVRQCLIAADKAALAELAMWHATDGFTDCNPLTASGEALDRLAPLWSVERRKGDAVPSPDRATGAALDALASSLDIKRAKATGSAYRGMTDRESDESLRARCMAKLGVPSRAIDMGEGVSAVRARETGDGRVAVSGSAGATVDYTVETVFVAKGFNNVERHFTQIHDATAPLRGTRLANPGGIPTASPEPTAEERAATAIADRRALDLGVPRREGEPLAAFTRRCNAVEVRRAVDRCVTADHGPFATARAAALHAWAETLYSHDTVADVAAVHAGLLRYEALRGSRREPSLAAMDVGVPETARAMYERERASKRVEAVTPPEEPARPTGGASLNGWQTAAHFWERWSR